MKHDFLEAAVQLAAAATLATTLYALAAFWAASARSSWFWRWAPLVLLLAALAPLGAYELMALFATQAAAIIGVSSAANWKRSRQLSSPAATSSALNEVPAPSAAPGPRPHFHWPQFGLLDVLKAVVLAAGVFALLRLAAPGTEATLGIAIDWWAWSATGATIGFVILVALWMLSWPAAGNLWRWIARIVVLALLAAAALAVPYLLNTFQAALSMVSFIESPLLVDFAPSATLLSAGLTVIVVLLLRLIVNSARLEPQSPGDAQPTSTIRKIATALSRGVLVVLALSGIWILGSFYLAVWRRRRPSSNRCPSQTATTN